MTNLLNLAQLPALKVCIVSGADWDDQFFQAAAGFTAPPTTTTATLETDSTTISVASTSGACVGSIVAGGGIAPGTTIESIGSDALTLSAEPTLNVAGATVTIYPPPLDLTGISFEAKVRQTAQSTEIILDCSTANGLMTNDGTNGFYGFNVPDATIEAASWPADLQQNGVVDCVMDIVATDASGATVNLCALNGPATVQVSLQVTR